MGLIFSDIGDSGSDSSAAAVVVAAAAEAAAAGINYSHGAHKGTRAKPLRVQTFYS